MANSLAQRSPHPLALSFDTFDYRTEGLASGGFSSPFNTRSPSPSSVPFDFDSPWKLKQFTQVLLERLKTHRSTHSTLSQPTGSASNIPESASLRTVPLIDLVQAITTPPKNPVNIEKPYQTPLDLPSVATDLRPYTISPSTPCIVPAPLTNANTSVSDRIQAERKSPNHDLHEERLEQELRSQSPEPHYHDVNQGDELTVSDQDEFWMHKSESSIPDAANVPQSDFVEQALHLANETKGPKCTTEYEGSDHESVIGRSTFTEETSSTADATTLTLPSNVDHTAVFNYVFDVLDDAFSAFESNGKETSGSRPVDEMVLDLPEFDAPNLLFGLRPDRSSCWKGMLWLDGRYTALCKLRKRGFEGGFIYGAEIGEVEDVDGYGGVTLFMGQDRKIYYTSTSGWFEEDHDGIFEYKVHGGFELRDFNMGKVTPFI